jgi:hypothetical protein|tara:strand:+ start:102 stop:599 length:498 start_codon:yes stop_codon:yes gene_type:complete
MTSKTPHGADTLINQLEKAMAEELAYRQNTPERLTAALAEAQRGPNDDDLECAPLLEGWAPVYDPICQRPILVGQPTGQVAHVEELAMQTAPVVAIDPVMGFARTHDRWYRLGTPAAKMAPGLMSEKLRETIAHFVAKDLDAFDSLVAAEVALVEDYLAQDSEAA